MMVVQIFFTAFYFDIIKFTDKNLKFKLKGYFVQLFGICCLVLLLRSCVGQNSNSMNKEQFIYALEKFGTQLHSELAATKLDHNVVFSPFSIQTCVFMALMGAEGETAKELQQGLGFGSNNIHTLAEYYFNILSEFKESPLLKIANKIYVKDDFKIQNYYNDALKEKLFSEIENIAFEENENAARKINSWVGDKTNHRIENLISPSELDETTRLVLLNAIHFKADWLHKFPKHLTLDKKFYIDETNSVKVPMMKVTQSFYYGQIQQLDAQVLEMAYCDSNLAMLIILPNKRTGLNEVEQKLKTTSLKDITTSMYHTEVTVEFPKFKVQFQMELSETFKKLGMQRMFSSNAQFGKMLETNESLQVSKIIHKAFIEVGEEGTEAAAATGTGVRCKRSLLEGQDRREFIVDHPFVYIIMKKILRNELLTLFKGSFIKHDQSIHITIDERSHDEL